MQLTLGYRATLFLSSEEAEQIVSALAAALQQLAPVGGMTDDLERERALVDAELMLYRNAYQDGIDAARSRCDICPARADVGQPVLIAGRYVLYRPGIEN